MITLEGNTETLQAVLSGAPATMQPTFIVSYTDLPSPQASGNQGTFTGVTLVTLVSAPAVNVCRMIRSISIYNGDTAAITFELFKVVGSTQYPFHKITLPSGYNATYAADRWVVTDASGNFVEIVQAVQSGSWTVNIGGSLPAGSNNIGSVNVANFPATQPIIGTVSVSNFPATQAVNFTQLAGTTLAGPTNYGTAPTGEVQGINAFVTNAVALEAGTAAIGTVGVTSLPAIPAGSNTIGAVNQGGGNWSINLSQVGTTSISLGQKTSSSSLPVVIASDQSTLNVDPHHGNQKSAFITLTSTSPVSYGGSSNTYLNGVIIVLSNYTANASQVTLFDGNSNVLIAFVIPNISTAVNQTFIILTGLSIPMNNGSNRPSVSIGQAPTTGVVYLTSIFT
ncbi:MAG TPA: hypothetical protein VJQ26_02630 [Ktedonobacteraceae bacterium]|nr:hypothetical protein [Ktedonobacteraceae bacterium]